MISYNKLFIIVNEESMTVIIFMPSVSQSTEWLHFCGCHTLPQPEKNAHGTLVYSLRNVLIPSFIATQHLEMFLCLHFSIILMSSATLQVPN